MTLFELLTRIEFILFCIAVYSCRKDPVLFKLSSLFALVHGLSIFYYPVGAITYLIESILCLVLGVVTINNSLRAWSIALGSIMGASILLRLLEFSDYSYNNYEYQLTWLAWIHITTAAEAIVFLMASNGLLQFYTRDWYSDSNYKQSGWLNIFHNQANK